MQKWLRATLVSAAALGGMAAAASPAASAATGEATARSDILAATAAADAKIPHKTIGGEASPTGASKPGVRPASVSAPAASAIQQDRDVATPSWTIWPINCDVVAQSPFKTGNYIYGRGEVWCDEATDGRYWTQLEYSNDNGRTWNKFGSAQVRTAPGEHFIVQKQAACALAAPNRKWRTYSEIFYNWMFNQYKTESDYSPAVTLKC